MPPGPVAPPRAASAAGPAAGAVGMPASRPPAPSGAPPLAPGLPPTRPAAVAGASPAAPRAPINPFLANDPNQKAKRLARALVSDMLTYHPGKREEGARNNTLKQLFREEIKKSYEEYVDQVGKEFADGTTHFQDALNDILGGGKKIF
ncbi:MAG: hypothetical protein NVS9B3_03960 [Gemmatimonadaceae bacterium]